MSGLGELSQIPMKSLWEKKREIAGLGSRICFLTIWRICMVIRTLTMMWFTITVSYGFFCKVCLCGHWIISINCAYVWHQIVQKNILQEIYVYTYCKRGLRSGGMTPALALRMPINTEDAWYVFFGKSRLQMRQYCQGVRTLKVNRIWMMKIEKTPESDAMNYSNNFCHPAHNDEHQKHAAAGEKTTAHRAATTAEIHSKHIQMHTRTS